MYKAPVMNDPNDPLVSVTVHNYNYGHYLRECLDSVYAQTYGNIEICFSDNASTDDSWETAVEYALKNPGTMNITRLRQNFGSYTNFANCLFNARGKYLVELCSDDALAPEFIEKCVKVLEAHPKLGFVMVHRAVIDENSRVTDEPPFYNQSCIIKGPEQAAVYMMASVNPSISQIMYNKKSTWGYPSNGIAAYATRMMDFQMCCDYDIAYLKEPLLLHRMHSQNDSSKVAENLMEIIGPYVLQHQFAITAAPYGMDKVIERLPKSIEKLSRLSLRYCVRALVLRDETLARRYLHLAAAIMAEITEDPVYKTLASYWTSDAGGKARIVDELGSTANLSTRSVSYDPPQGSIPLDIGSLPALRACVNG